MLTFVLALGVLAATDNLHSEQYKEQSGLIEQYQPTENVEQAQTNVDAQRENQALLIEEHLQARKND